MNRRPRLSALALAALSLLAAPALRGMDDWERQVKISPDTLIRGVSIPSAFRGLNGKLQPAGLYDLKLNKGTQGILIGLLRNGKTVAEFPGKFAPAKVDPSDPNLKAGMGDGSVKPAGTQDIHFDSSSKVAYGSGGGEGKISVSNNLHPGGTNLGTISFQLPPAR